MEKKSRDKEKMGIGRFGTALGISGQLRGVLREGPLAPTVAFALTIAYVVLDYGRPQDTIPILQKLKLSLITSGLLAFTLVRFNRSVPWFRPQVLFLTAILGFMAAWVPFATNNYWAFKNVNYGPANQIYMISQKALFYAFDFNEDGIWDLMYKDIEEDGVNGNETFYASPSSMFSASSQISDQ